MRAERREIALRIVLDRPIPALPIALQRGPTGTGTLIPPVSRSAKTMVFELEAIVDGALADGRPRLLGPFVQGPPDARFVYLVVGHPGAAGSGRTKVLLSDLDWAPFFLPAGGREIIKTSEN